MTRIIKEMLEELRENNLTEVCVDNKWCEAYKGLRANTCIIVDTDKEFIEDMNSMLLLIDDSGDTILNENIELAHKYMLIQKFALPHII